jgi:hypothetical protein
MVTAQSFDSLPERRHSVQLRKAVICVHCAPPLKPEVT